MSSRTIPSLPVRLEIQPGIWLDSRLALWLSDARLLVVADLHWGYTASHRARGNLLPWWGDDEIEQRLWALLADYQPEEMIWLGDVVHAAEGSARAEAFLQRASLPIAHVAGNHDRRWRSAGAKSVTRGAYFFHHGDTAPTLPPECIEVIGHHHPAVSWWDGAGGRLKVPALVASTGRNERSAVSGLQAAGRKGRLVLPAFSPWAGGTPWQVDAENDETLWAVTPHRIFALPRAKSASKLSASS